MAHRTLPVFADSGFVILRDHEGPAIPRSEWMGLEYVDWKSGGDTNFAPLASALGEMECAGFWDHGKPDKDGIWTRNREIAPTLVSYVEAVGARYGRVRVIKLNPSEESEARRQLHLDDNNRLNPDGEGWVVRSWLELTDNNAKFILREDKGEAATESVIPLHAGMQFVIDTQRLWHVVHNPGPEPRYAMITSWESGDALQTWIDAQLPVGQGVGAR
jgi:hypothetical protein